MTKSSTISDSKDRPRLFSLRGIGLLVLGESIALVLILTTPPGRPLGSVIISAHALAHFIVAMGVALHRKTRQLRSEE